MSQEELATRLTLYSLARAASAESKSKKSDAAKGKGEAKKKPQADAKPVKRDLVDFPNKPERNAETESVSKEKFYLTTAINYTNGDPHIGHAYEAVTSDVICRYHRQFGRDVFFLTGADEHGQKVQQSAETLGVTPQDIADKYSSSFKACNIKYKISNDEYIRTTEARHKELAVKVWNLVKEKGDIYLDSYKGWYNVHDEAYVTPQEAEASDYKDEHGRPYEEKTEESYFFRMSKYQKALLAHIDANPKFIMPPERKSEIVAFLEQNELHDLCISRTVCQWGIQCPKDDEYKGDLNHVMYVWFDALTNYLSGIGYLTDSPRASYWPASVHIIGKDITRFHTIYWPCMLLSAGIPLPKAVFGHGFVNDEKNHKMGKSLGNAVDPIELAKRFPSDSLRFYMVREAPYGNDLPFNVSSLVDLHNANLNNGLGNLLNRAVHLCKKYCDGRVPQEASHKLDGKFPMDVETLRKQAEEFMSVLGPEDDTHGLQLHNYCRIVVDATASVNKFLTDTDVWHLKGEEHLPLQRAVVRAVLESLYVLGHYYLPILTEGASLIFEQIGVKPTKIISLSSNLDNLPVGTQVVVGGVMYPALTVNGPVLKKDQVKNNSKESYEKAKQEKKARQAANNKKGGKAAAADPNQPEFTKIDIRVGRITKVWEHPDSEKLWCEEIDVGEEKPRQIASGLRAHYSLDKMQDKDVLVVCNLKAAKLGGFASEGMVLCTKDDSKVEFVDPPAGSKPGDRIGIKGTPVDKYEPMVPNQVKKKKIWEAVAAKLKCNADRVACWDGIELVDGAGNTCIAPTLAGNAIS